MEVILLENVRNLGAFGATVRVANGYARNFLLPKGKAVPATKNNIAEFESRRAEFQKKAQENLQTAQGRADVLAGLGVITIAARAADEGKLYGSIGTYDIAAALEAAGAKIERQEIRLPNGALRELGEFDIQIQLHPEVELEIKLHVVAEE